jgi:hypothetical protein
VLNLDSRELTRVGLVGAGARFTPTGHLVYVGQDASLMAIAGWLPDNRTLGY